MNFRKKGENIRGIISGFFLVLLLWPAAGLNASEADNPRLVRGFSSYSEFPEGATWEKHAPEIRTIRIRSSADGSEQPALYYDSGSSHRKPLLVALHSWSFDYRQPVSIPYGIWAVQNDWVFIHPNFRGRFNRPEATASDLVISDIVDALEYALEHAAVDSSRIYLAGFSGGAMNALILAGKYPDLWNAVSAWVPIYDLRDWYDYSTRFPEKHYAGDIAGSCGGAPEPGTEAARECAGRSPVTYLKEARGKGVKIYIACGIKDDVVPPSHSLWAFNDLARPEDRIPDEDIAYIAENHRLPSHMANGISDELYEKAGAPLLFKRESGNVTLALFDGGHDLLFNPALFWLHQQSSALREGRIEKEE